MHRAFLLATVVLLVGAPVAFAQPSESTLDRLQGLSLRELESLPPEALEQEESPEQATPVDAGSLREILDMGDRQVHVGVEDERARIQYARDNVSGDARVGVLVDPERGVVFVSEKEDGRRLAETLRIQLVRVVTFDDIDGDGAYTSGEDRVVTNVPARRVAWSVDPVRDAGGAAGEPGHHVHAEGVVPDAGRVHLDVLAAGSFAEDRGDAFKLTDLEVGFGVPAGQDSEGAAASNRLLAFVVEVRQRGDVADVDVASRFPFASQGVTLLRGDGDAADAIRTERYVVTAGPAGTPGPGDERALEEDRAPPAAAPSASRPPQRAADLLPNMAQCATLFIC